MTMTATMITNRTYLEQKENQLNDNNNNQSYTTVKETYLKKIRNKETNKEYKDSKMDTR